MDTQMNFSDMFENVVGGVEQLTSTIEEDKITEEVSKIFDYDFQGTVTEEIEIPTFPNDFEIGLIVGSSGSGKSTILKERFGEEEHIEWDNHKAIASHFNSFQEASEKFGAVGLNSIPTWLKPYNVLSNGEKFRADMARRLKSGAVVDEFTSVVNRDVAISCSCSIEKYIRNNHLKNIVFCSCHDDIIPYLQPTWIYNTDKHEFHNGRYLQRPKLELRVYQCDKSMWNMFKKYHYLSGELNSASVCYVAVLNNRPVAFMALLTLCGRDVKHAWREHRVVVLPDFQGMGIGNKMSEMIAQGYIEKGCTYYCKTSNPRMGEHREKSASWRATATNRHSRESYLNKDGSLRDWNPRYGMKQNLVKKHAYRVCYSHEYIGDGTKYPYTYKTQNDLKKNDIDGQINIFDLIGENNA